MAALKTAGRHDELPSNETYLRQPTRLCNLCSLLKDINFHQERNSTLCGTIRKAKDALFCCSSNERNIC